MRSCALHSYNAFLCVMCFVFVCVCLYVLFFQMLVSLEGQILILDEAHNMEDASRAAASLDVTDIQFSELKEELLGLRKSSLRETYVSFILVPYVSSESC